MHSAAIRGNPRRHEIGRASREMQLSIELRLTEVVDRYKNKE
jgi:hypothetical protein